MKNALQGTRRVGQAEVGGRRSARKRRLLWGDTGRRKQGMGAEARSALPSYLLNDETGI